MKIESNLQHKKQKTRIVFSFSPLLIPILTLIVTSCSDFVDDKPSQTPPTIQQPAPPAPAQNPQSPQAPEPPKTPPPPSKGETESQREWRLCETERIWAFNAHLIDSGAFQIFERRNFAPVFNQPGVRQSGIEGWYGCQYALQANGFIPAQSQDGSSSDRQSADDGQSD